MTIPRRVNHFLVLVLLVTTGLSCAGGKPRPSVKPSLNWVVDPASPEEATVEARGAGWDAPPSEDTSARRADDMLRVYVVGGLTKGDPSVPMLGTCEITDGVLRFRPRFPLQPGVRYVAVLEMAGSPPKQVRAVYDVPPRPATMPTVVTNVYPSAAELPENLLKFYVLFSAPMSRGDIYRHVKLIDESTGREVDIPFLELEEELWDPAMTRLTLFIDPGRIKRGVRPLEEVGPALEQGKRYTLLIDRDLTDATGRAMGQDFRKSFAVGPPLREPPDPAKWTVTPPSAFTRAPLAIEFPHPMDHALAERLIRVTTTSGQVEPGEVMLSDAERRWTFTPNGPWTRGRYEVVVQPTVEDLAGNNVGKLFEVDLKEGAEGRPDLAPVRLPVDVR